MPRQPRRTAAGATYHVVFRGNRRQVLYPSVDDYRRYLWGLGDAARRCGWSCLSWSLLGNHGHLVVETPADTLSRGMHRLQGLYAQWFNDVHGVDGHLFQGRFHSTLVEREEHLLELSRYVALNPVRAGLCFSPEDWPWSSYAATIGRVPRPRYLAADRLLAHFGDDPEDGRRTYAAFVRSGLTERAVVTMAV